MGKTETILVVHELEPLWRPDSRVLILGTMPSPKSREAGFYYAHPQNRFWRTLARVFGEELPQTTEEKRDMVLRRHIALWDVLESCEIRSASDASIKNPIPNKLNRILDYAQICAVFTTGRKAQQLYDRHCLHKMTELPAVCLPSTSPANCSVSEEELLRAYMQIREFLQ